MTRDHSYTVKQYDFKHSSLEGLKQLFLNIQEREGERREPTIEDLVRLHQELALPALLFHTSGYASKYRKPDKVSFIAKEQSTGNVVGALRVMPLETYVSLYAPNNAKLRKTLQSGATKMFALGSASHITLYAPPFRETAIVRETPSAKITKALITHAIGKRSNPLRDWLDDFCVHPSIVIDIPARDLNKRGVLENEYEFITFAEVHPHTGEPNTTEDRICWYYKRTRDW